MTRLSFAPFTVSFPLPPCCNQNFCGHRWWDPKTFTLFALFAPFVQGCLRHKVQGRLGCPRSLVNETSHLVKLPLPDIYISGGFSEGREALHLWVILQICLMEISNNRCKYDGIPIELSLNNFDIIIPSKIYLIFISVSQMVSFRHKVLKIT